MVDVVPFVNNKVISPFAIEELLIVPLNILYIDHSDGLSLIKSKVLSIVPLLKSNLVA